MIRTVAQMGTIVTVQVVGHASDPPEITAREQSVERALAWFQRVEDCCTRFDPASELRRLTAHIGEAIPVSDLLFEVVQFALAVAEASGGAFDPTVGASMERHGFNRHYRTGLVSPTAVELPGAASYRDVQLDPARKTIQLFRPLVLDLGAVAKGLAIDMAARELRSFEHFAIDAGGDLYLGGSNAAGEPWSVGIRHPRRDRELIEMVQLSNSAVCTSGDYERRSSADNPGHHILDPRTGSAVESVASVTVVAPTAMAADALATAAFVLGPKDGIHFLEQQGVSGLILTPTLERFSTGPIWDDDGKLGARGVQSSAFNVQSSRFVPNPEKVR